MSIYDTTKWKTNLGFNSCFESFDKHDFLLFLFGLSRNSNKWLVELSTSVRTDSKTGLICNENDVQESKNKSKAQIILNLITGWWVHHFQECWMNLLLVKPHMLINYT